MISNYAYATALVLWLTWFPRDRSILWGERMRFCSVKYINKCVEYVNFSCWICEYKCGTCEFFVLNACTFGAEYIWTWKLNINLCNVECKYCTHCWILPQTPTTQSYAEFNSYRQSKMSTAQQPIRFILASNFQVATKYSTKFGSVTSIDAIFYGKFNGVFVLRPTKHERSYSAPND